LLQFGRLAWALGALKTGALWLGRGLLALGGVGVSAFLLLGTAAYLWITRWRDIIGGAKLLWTDLTTWLRGLAQRWLTVGAALVDGITQGIRNRWESLKSTIGEMAGSVKSTFTNLLGIRSPSTVFMGFGGNIAEGAALGIQGRLARVKQAATGLAAATLASAGAALASPAAAAQAGAGAGGAGITIHYAPTINAADVTGVRDALATSQAELERMLNRVLADKQRRSLAS